MDSKTIRAMHMTSTVYIGSRYSCFEKGCREKCTRQSLKALCVVLSSLFEKKFEGIGTKGHGNVFASAKGKQQK